MDYCFANREDIGAILDLYKQLVDSNDSSFTLEMANKIWDEVEKYNIKYFLVKDNDKIIGTCYLCIIPNLTYNGKSIGFIENVIVDNNYRKKGVGKKLMEMATNYAKENNCYKAVLKSGINRVDAHKFYRNIGFDGESRKAFEINF